MNDGDDTKRVRMVVHEEVEPMAIAARHLEKRTKWLTPIFVLVAGGFGAGAWLYVNFARASDLEFLAKRQDAQAEKVSEVSAKVQVIQSEQRYISEEIRYQRDQLSEIAKAVRARVLPPPKEHDHTRHIVIPSPAQ